MSSIDATKPNPVHEDIITRDSERAVEVPGVVTWYQSPKEMEQRMFQ